MPYRAPVVDSSGSSIGSAESLLGDEGEDIFHGIVVKRSGDGKLVEIMADQIQRITNLKVYTSVAPDQVLQLEAYREERWFHLGWGGLFRKHPDWQQEKEA